MTPETEERISVLVKEVFDLMAKHHVPGKFNLDVMACALMVVQLQLTRSATFTGRKDSIVAAVNAATAIFTASVEADMKEAETTANDLLARLGITVGRDSPTAE